MGQLEIQTEEVKLEAIALENVNESWVAAMNTYVERIDRVETKIVSRLRDQFAPVFRRSYSRRKLSSHNHLGLNQPPFIHSSAAYTSHLSSTTALQDLHVI